MAIQEPYCYDRKIALLGNLQVLHYTNPDENPYTSFVVINKNLNVQLQTNHTNRYFTTIIIHHEGINYVMITFYCSPYEDITEPLNELNNTVQHHSKFPILIMGDFNVKSPIWFSPIEDPRGSKLVELMNSLGLQSLNTSKLPTYSSTTGESWVDVCLANKHLADNKIQCSTLSEHTASDHNYIGISIEIPGGIQKLKIKQKTNWEIYQKHITENWNSHNLAYIDNIKDLEEIINKLQMIIQIAYYKATKINTVKQTSPW
ncbi:uncharacterized protein [Centruroides vittatus]|uniref:uncharacterized protein n=1 Tax=Centruroides vittatus TaxID=120091 RepID=UPI00350FE30B